MSSDHQRKNKQANDNTRQKQQPDFASAEQVYEIEQPVPIEQAIQKAHLSRPNAVMQLQRTIGNRATRNLLTQQTSSTVVQRGLFSKIKGLFGGKKAKNISGPTDGRKMDESEYGEAKSMKQLMEQKAQEDGEVTNVQNLPEDIFEKIKAMSTDIGDAITDFFTAGEILMNAQDVANPKLMDEHQKRYIMPRKKFAIRKDGKWTKETYSYDDDGVHVIETESSTGEYYIGKLGDGTTVAGVKKAYTTTGGYEKLDPETPLFEKGQPNVEDVKQGEIGDCYLMAALASVAQQNPNYIREIMVDRGDKVSVRLYEVDQTDPSDHKFNAKYITIEKSVAKLAGRQVYNKGALWVSMLEKAYAAGGFTGTGKAATSTTSTTMEDIAGGFSRHAFEVLMGEKAKSENLAGGPRIDSGGDFETQEQTGWQGNQYWFDRTKVGLPWDASTVAAYDTIKSGPQPDDYTPLPIFQGIFKGNKDHLEAWIKYVKTGAVKDMFDKQNTELSGGYAHQITIQDFQALFNKEGAGVSAGVGNAVLEWIKTNKMFPGDIGTGVYSKSQLKSFETIKDAIANGQAVALNTHKYPSHKSEGSGHSGGESMSKGIVGGHAYSALGTKANTSNDPKSEVGSGSFHWIHVRNPWGSYGREYKFEGVLPEEAGKAVKEGDGAFFLELTDLTKYFDSVDISG